MVVEMGILLIVVQILVLPMVAVVLEVVETHLQTLEVQEVLEEKD